MATEAGADSRDAAEVHLSTGVLWFWGLPWWARTDVWLRPLVRGVHVLCAPVDRVLPLPPVEVIQELSRHVAVTLHPTFDGRGGIRFDSRVETAFRETAAWMERTGVRDVLLHSDHFPRGLSDVAEVRRRLPEANLLVENMGMGNEYGCRPEQIRRLLEGDASLGFVMDVAHWYEVSGGSGDLRPWLEDPVIGSRLRMSHVSTSGLRDPIARGRCLPEIAEATHLPAFLNTAYPSGAARARLGQCPLIAEGCLPKGEVGLCWLDRELEYLSAWRTQCPVS